MIKGGQRVQSHFPKRGQIVEVFVADILSQLWLVALTNRDKLLEKIVVVDIGHVEDEELRLGGGTELYAIEDADLWLDGVVAKLQVLAGRHRFEQHFWVGLDRVVDWLLLNLGDKFDQFDGFAANMNVWGCDLVNDKSCVLA